MKLFFNSNKQKLTTRKPRECRSFVFTDKDIREYDYDISAGTYSDKICRGLKISVSRNGNHTFFYQNQKHSKVIGSIYNISVDKAREICNNINENEEEFNTEYDNIKINLYGYFQKYGPFPHHQLYLDALLEPEEEDPQKKIIALNKQVDTLVTLNDHYLAENEYLRNTLAQIRAIIADVDKKDEDDDDDNVA